MVQVMLTDARGLSEGQILEERVVHRSASVLLLDDCERLFYSIPNATPRPLSHRFLFSFRLELVEGLPSMSVSSIESFVQGGRSHLSRRLCDVFMCQF